MPVFSLKVSSICIGAIFSLMLYTVFLLRSEKLSSHIAVRWILAEFITILTLLLWGALPFINYTSVLQDRELFVILAVIFFGFTSYLILDSLVNISLHKRQVKRLTQEVALLREVVQKQERSSASSD